MIQVERPSSMRVACLVLFAAACGDETTTGAVSAADANTGTETTAPEASGGAAGSGFAGGETDHWVGAEVGGAAGQTDGLDGAIDDRPTDVRTRDAYDGDATLVTHNLWIVFGPGTIRRDLPGLFQCLLGRSDFSERASAYKGGYGLAWGGSASGTCAGGDYACAVSTLHASALEVADHDVVLIVVHGYCGGDNNGRLDGVKTGSIRVRGGNVGDCPTFPQGEERVAVHEAFEAAGDWANADCCTGEVNTSCPDMGESFCPDCPCSCGRFAQDGSYGGYTLDCGGGKTYWSQRVPTSVSNEFNPSACTGFALR